ncbi:Voltage-gated ion channel, partial [Globisporangium splendens]
MVDERGRMLSKVVPAKPSRRGSVELLDDNLASVLAHQEQDPSLVTIMLMWRIPYSISFSEDGKEVWHVFYKVTGAIYYLDIIANFRRKVAVRYVKGWFFIDLIGSIPIEYFVGTNNSGIERKAIKASVKYLRLMAYGESLYAAATLLLNISSVPVNRESAFMCAVLAVVGFMFNCLTLASVTTVVMGSSSRAVQYQDKVRAVMNDLKSLNIPVELRKSTKAYYETLWSMENTSDRYEKAIYDDEDLSPALRSEIALYIHRSLITTAPLFQGCSDSCLACVVMKLKTQLYMRGDVVFHKGDPTNSMMIISCGKVKVISPDNEAILAVLKQGCFFGEIGLLRNMTRSCTVISATFCELKTLQRRDAEEVFNLYPQIYDRLFAEFEKRRRDTSLCTSIYNVKVLDNAHAVDVSNVKSQGKGGEHREPFIHGSTAASSSVPAMGDNRSEGSCLGGKPKLVRGNSFQSEESMVIHAELDSMGLSLQEIERLLESLKSAQTNLAKVHDRRLPIHQALSAAARSTTTGATVTFANGSLPSQLFTPVGHLSRSPTPLTEGAPQPLHITKKSSKLDKLERELGSRLDSYQPN